MFTISGIVLNEFEILNEHGLIERHTTTLARKTTVWLHYNTAGQLIVIERKGQKTKQK